MTYYSYTNIGPRKENEDSYFIESLDNEIFGCIADGVGGVNYGKEASAFAIEYFKSHLDSFKADSLLFIKNLNEEIIKYSSDVLNTSKIATTFTALEIKNRYLRGVHTGDSRAYILRNNGLKQLTFDYNEAGRLYKEKKISVAEKNKYHRKNILESYIGCTDNFQYHAFEFELLKNDRIILSTDGFHDLLSKIDIRDISVKYKKFHEFYNQLVIDVENRELFDNTTFICIDIQ